MDLARRLRDGLAEGPAITLYCADDLADHVAVLTANVEGVDPLDVGAILDGDFGIAVRVGVHCAPMVHRDLGTIDRGAVRFSPGVFTTAEDIDRAIAAMRAIPHHRRGQQRPPTVGPPRRVVSQGGSGPAGHADVTLYRLGQAALLLAPRQAVARLGRSGPRPGGRASDAGRDR